MATRAAGKARRNSNGSSCGPEKLVVEVSFDQSSGGRIRHGTKLLRWREDKAPRDCALSQMQA